MPTAATNPTFPTVNNVAVRKQADWLEIAIKTPGATTPVYDRIPMLSEFGAYAPNTQDTDLPLFVNASGQSVTLRSSLANGGTISFAVAAHANDPVFAKLLSAAANAYPVTYKAHYASMELTIQGQGTIKDRGMQGDANSIPQWGFDLLTMTAEYVGNDGNIIGT